MAAKKTKAQRIRKPTRGRTLSKRNEKASRTRFDRSCLNASLHEPQVHRDYGAHFFRWGFARRFINTRARLLDVGCGTDGQLVKVLHAYLNHVPELYVGVDLNKLPTDRTPQWSWTNWIGKCDATKDLPKIAKKHGQFGVICCFEVIEHMSAADGKRLLSGMRDVLAPAGKILLSTPVYDGMGIARNHRHEYKTDELAKVIKAAGFVVEERFGTFARQRDLAPVLDADEKRVLRRLKQYYDDDVVACFLAPTHPDESRNNVWVLRDKRHVPETVEPLKAGPRSRKPGPKPGRKKKVAAKKARGAKRTGATSGTSTKKRTRSPGGGRKPGSGEFIREHLMKGTDPEKILALVHKQFAGSKATRSDVSWNRRKLRLAGKEPKS